MEGLLKVGALFDWITPLIGFAQTARYGRSVGFRIPENQGWNSTRVRDVLVPFGVTSWGYLWVGDSLLFQVKLRQARFAEYLLTRAGAPYSCGAYQHPAAAKLRPRKRAAVRQRRAAGSAADLCDAVLSELQSAIRMDESPLRTLEEADKQIECKTRRENQHK